MWCRLLLHYQYADSFPYETKREATNRHTKTDTQRHTDTQIHRYTDTQTYRHTDTQTHKHIDIQIHKYTNTQRGSAQMYKGDGVGREQFK
eukprot:SAG31_NODE_27010_length_432_cov_1.321321_1_plen_89_part_01